MRKVLLLTITLITFLTGFANSGTFHGVASYYGSYFHGRKTASGEVYDQYKLTAAHKTLPLGTVVKVTNVSNSKSVFLKINDRGPYIKGRVIDVSTKAADLLGFKMKGTAQVIVEVVTPEEVPSDLTKGYEEIPVVSNEKNIDTKIVSNIPKDKFLTWSDIPTVDNDNNPTENPVENNLVKNQDAILNKSYMDKSALLEKSANGHFGIDLGDFDSLAELIEIIKKLEQQYKQPVYFEEIATNENITIYKLFVGNYKNRSFADALKIKLSAEYKNCAVVQY